MVEVKIVAIIKVPKEESVFESDLLALVAKPIATPAWGISVKPKYFLTSGSAFVIVAPNKEPQYLPITLEIT